MQRDDLIRLYPRLYHMAEPGSWSLIEAQGLRSTEALLDLFEADPATRHQLLSCHRPQSVALTHPVHGTAVVRDQKPLPPSKLALCLNGMTVAEWYEALNGRVFFWLQEVRLQRLLNARPYRKKEQLVITVDTAALLDQVPEGDVTLSRINSGSAIFSPSPRGIDTFKSITDYSHKPRDTARAAADDIAELCVRYAVPAIADVTIKAETWAPDGSRTPVYP